MNKLAEIALLELNREEALVVGLGAPKEIIEEQVLVPVLVALQVEVVAVGGNRELLVVNIGDVEF